MGPLLYSTATRAAVDATLAKHKVRITGIMDDKYIMGPPKEALMAMETYASELAKLCLRLQHNKSAAIHGTALTPTGGKAGSYAAAMEACKLHGIALVDGLLVGGAPVGSPEYVDRELSDMVGELTDHMEKVRAVIVHQSTLNGKGNPNLRMGRLYKLIRWCLAPAMINYTLRTTPTEDVLLHARWYDEQVFKIVMELLGVPEGHAHTDRSTARGRLLRDRVNLLAGGVGLGITSAAMTAHDARLGSILLTAPLVAQALGEGFDSTMQGEVAIPDLLPLLEAKETKDLELEQLKGLTVERAFVSSRRQISKALAQARKEKRLKAVLNQVDDPEAKAWLLSCGGEGATYLMAEDSALAYGVQPLPNELFKALGRARVGLQPAPYRRLNESGTSPPAASPPPSRWDSLCPRVGCGKPMGPNGLHHLTCLEAGKGGAKGMRAYRHANVKRALRAAMRRVAGERTVPLVEPDLRILWLEKASYKAGRAEAQQAAQAPAPAPAATTTPTGQAMEEEHGTGQGAPSAQQATALGSPPPGPSSQLMADLPEEATEDGKGDWCNKPRGDISWKSNDGPVVFDLVITHPLPRSCPTAATEAGSAANKAHCDKINKYNRRFETRGMFEPIAVETGGRLHPDSLKALKAFIKTSMGLGDGPLPPDEAHQYQLALRSVLDSLAVSLAREVAQALLSGGPGGTRAPARARVREYEGRGGAQ
jgi:hypothetical protein